MDYIALILVAVSLAMDAFAVSVCNGIVRNNVKIYHAIIFGLTFGGFQFLMPLAGYFLGTSFIVHTGGLAYWIAFTLLAFIGGKMLLDTFRACENENSSCGPALSLCRLFVLGIATSIDAMAVGVTIPVACWNIWLSAIIIGGASFAFSFVGVLAGKMLGNRYQKNASRLGALVLIGIGIKILIENLITSV